MVDVVTVDGLLPAAVGEWLVRDAIVSMHERANAIVFNDRIYGFCVDVKKRLQCALVRTIQG